MLNSEKVGNELYQYLGKLFYAVAIADRTIHLKELEKLKEMVRKHWLDVDDIEDEYGEDAAFQIEVVFDWLLEYEKDGHNCFNEFKVFFKEHPSHFTPEIKDIIMATANAIARSFAGTNKSELVILAKLKLLLDQV